MARPFTELRRVLVMGRNIMKLKIEWSGPITWKKVIAKKNDEGEKPEYDGEDYGLYQIYGRHILAGENTLLYVGQATDQTFSARFSQHKKWLKREEHQDDLKVFLGRAYDEKRHAKKDNWQTWRDDLSLAEKIIIYRYSPNYNSSNIAERPTINPYIEVRLVHEGKRHRLKKEDNAPDDW